MDTQQKNNLVRATIGLLDSAIAMVTAEVYTGLMGAPPLLSAGANLLLAAGLTNEANQAGARAGECGAILAIPWPFIYAGSTVWIGAVARLRDSLPQFIDLGPALRKAERTQRQTRFEALSAAQKDVLAQVGLTAAFFEALD